MNKFYNYDARGASEATQIVNLERMVQERDAEIERLRTLLLHAVEGLEDEGHDLSDPDCGACKLIKEIREKALNNG
jgi:hypothetical protein